MPNPSQSTSKIPTLSFSHGTAATPLAGDDAEVIDTEMRKIYGGNANRPNAYTFVKLVGAAGDKITVAIAYYNPLTNSLYYGDDQVVEIPVGKTEISSLFQTTVGPFKWCPMIRAVDFDVPANGEIQISSIAVAGNLAL